MDGQIAGNSPTVAAQRVKTFQSIVMTNMLHVFITGECPLLKQSL